MKGLGSRNGWEIGEGASYKICNKEIEPIIVDAALQKLAEHILFVPVNLTSPFVKKRALLQPLKQPSPSLLPLLHPPLLPSALPCTSQSLAPFEMKRKGRLLLPQLHKGSVIPGWLHSLSPQPSLQEF